MERRFKVLDGDGEVIRTFLTKADAIRFMEMRPEFTLHTLPAQPKPDLFNELGECLL